MMKTAAFHKFKGARASAIVCEMEMARRPCRGWGRRLRRDERKPAMKRCLGRLGLVRHDAEHAGPVGTGVRGRAPSHRPAGSLKAGDPHLCTRSRTLLSAGVRWLGHRLKDEAGRGVLGTVHAGREEVQVGVRPCRWPP